jgi:hypothetical protein
VAQADLGLRDYKWVSGLLPGRVAPMDLDCVLEKNGHILILEFKPKDMAMGMGQRITLKAFAKLGADVWVIYGDGPMVRRTILNAGGVEEYPWDMTVEELAEEVTDWYADASVKGGDSVWTS